MMKIKFSNVVGVNSKMLIGSFVFVLTFLLGTVSLNAQSFQTNDYSDRKESAKKFPDQDQLLDDIATDYSYWKGLETSDPLVEVNRAVRITFLQGLLAALNEHNMLAIRAFDYAERQTVKRATDFSVPVNVSQIRNEYFDKYSK